VERERLFYHQSRESHTKALESLERAQTLRQRLVSAIENIGAPQMQVDVLQSALQCVEDEATQQVVLYICS
jgi:glycosyltransferase A (GT-A) superfamily protein (DUF2064 family)